MTIEPYSATIELADDRARAILAPDHGAAVLRYDRIDNGRIKPIFRPTPQICRTTSDFAMNVMLPWVNRISGGGFCADGVFHPLEPNVAGQPFPIHGNGFQSRWTVVRQTETAAVLALTSDGPGPYRYHAKYDFRLEHGALTVALAVANRAATALPFGVGFHPWIVRHPDMHLRAPASRFWLEDERHLPTRAVPAASAPDLDFQTDRMLPKDWINTSFEGWDGEAVLRSVGTGEGIGISAPAPLGIYHLYSPGAEARFVCFEPVTHIVDGFNRRAEMDPQPDDHLAPDAELRVNCRFTPLG